MAMALLLIPLPMSDKSNLGFHVLYVEYLPRAYPRGPPSIKCCLALL